jgi:protein O-GlcNAc transferase
MLGSHPSIYRIPFETNAFLKRRRTAAAAKARLEEIAEARAKRDVSYICEKTPRHIRRIGLITETIPDARFVIMVRDPRDTIASLKRRGLAFETALNRWLLDTKFSIEWGQRPNACLVRYEDLVKDPAQELARAVALLSLRYEPAMLNYWQDQQEWGKKRRKPKGENHRLLRDRQVHQPVMSDRVGTYHDQLDDKELETIRSAAGEKADELGYAITDSMARLQSLRSS